MKTTMQLESYLKKHFNYTNFLQGQKEIIEDILKGHNVLGILPTGSGKSLCYQLPAKLLSGITIVVSPLISLMLDQVKQLKAIQYKDVAALNSLISWHDRRDILKNLQKYSLIYVSPELLQDEYVLNSFKQIEVSLFVIDEAHCVSQWGHEFRTDYLRLPNVIKQLKNPPVLALSATAPSEVQEDIVNLLQLETVEKHIYPIDRPNIALVVERTVNEHEKIERLIKILQSYRVPTLIYFLSRKKSEEMAALLKEKLPDKQIAYYHGGMESFDRISVQQQFMNDDIDIICCTSAFGMGINKKDIRLIIHFHLPIEVESFIQEIGRAGRDGEESVSVLLYSDQDIYIPLNIIEQQLPNEQELRTFFSTLYQLNEQNELIPTTTEALEQLFQMPEVKIRFMLYQFEKHNMIAGNKVKYNKEEWKNIHRKLNQFINKRLNYKQQNLNKMVTWLNTEQCLRKVLYSSFQYSYEQPVSQCCSTCHFSFEKWTPIETERITNINLSWQTKLAQILQVGD